MTLSQCPISCASETSQVLSPATFSAIPIFPLSFHRIRCRYCTYTYMYNMSLGDFHFNILAYYMVVHSQGSCGSLINHVHVHVYTSYEAVEYVHVYLLLIAHCRLGYCITIYSTQCMVSKGLLAPPCLSGGHLIYHQNNTVPHTQ